jgi:alkylated DNA repair dioxygenase AlkB
MAAPYNLDIDLHAGDVLVLSGENGRAKPL